MNAKKIIVILLLITNYCNAQSILIKGKVLNLEDSSEIANAHLQLKNENIGSITNTDGSFSLFIKANQLRDSLIFSYLGFENKSVLVSKDTSINIYLSPKSIKLDEIIVSPINTGEIIKKAIKKLSQSYNRSRFLYEYFYKSLLEIDNKWFMSSQYRLIESLGDLYFPDDFKQSPAKYMTKSGNYLDKRLTFISLEKYYQALLYEKEHQSGLQK